jgi:hypothetical protein
MPDLLIRTSGGVVDLQALVGQEVQIANAEGMLCARLLSMNEREMRIFELEEALADMIGHFAHRKVDGDQFYTQGDSVLERAFKILGLPEGFKGEELKRFYRASRAKETQTKAENAVKT